jgi:uncharacterized RDD family membrane protein YckC
MIGSWLGGPRSLAQAAGIELGYPGERLGLPAAGVNSVAGSGRRLAATFIDWIIGSMIVRLFVPHPSWVEKLWQAPAAFAIINLALVTTVGAGMGGMLLRTRVARLDGTNPPFVSVLLRTFLIMLAVPALIWDRDGRGLHDRFAQTVVVVRR